MGEMLCCAEGERQFFFTVVWLVTSGLCLFVSTGESGRSFGLDMRYTAGVY